MPHDAPGLPTWRYLASVGEEQHGLVTVADARSRGVARSTLDGRVRRGEMTRRTVGVVALPGAADTPLQRVTAMLLRAPHAAATGWTAAWLWGLAPAAPTKVELVVPFHLRGPTSGNVTVRRSRTLIARDVTSLDGLPVVTVERLLVELAGRAELSVLRRIGIDARQQGHLDLCELDRVVRRAGRVRGVRRVTRLLDELDSERADSILEHHLRRRAIAEGLQPHPEPYPVRVRGVTLHLDVAFPRALVAVEPEGLASHATRAQLEQDHRRSNLLALTDWRILRVSWDEAQRNAWLEQLRALLSARSDLSGLPGGR